MRISDWSSDVCSSDLPDAQAERVQQDQRDRMHPLHLADRGTGRCACLQLERGKEVAVRQADMGDTRRHLQADRASGHDAVGMRRAVRERSDEHTSELQSLMRISYAVFCLNKKII